METENKMEVDFYVDQQSRKLKCRKGVFSHHGPMWHSLSMLYGPIHSAEECTTVLYQAVKVHFLKEVTLSLTEVIRVKP